MIPSSTADNILHLLSFIKEADLYPGTEKQWILAPLSPFCKALLFHDAVEALVGVMLTLTEKPVSETGQALYECFVLVERMLNSSPGYTWMEAAIEKGLLRVIVASATLECAGRLHRHLRFLLRQLIPSGLVVYHNVLQLQLSLEEVEDSVSTDAFQNSQLMDEWDYFMNIAEERIEVLYEIEGRVSSKACDNLEVRSFIVLTEPHSTIINSAARSMRRPVSEDALAANRSTTALRIARRWIGSTGGIALLVACTMDT